MNMSLKRGALLASLIAFALASLVSAQEAARPGKPRSTGSLPPGRPKANAAFTPRSHAVGTSYYRMGFGEFIPMIEGLDSQANTLNLDASTARMYGLNGGDFFIASPNLPAGARLVELVVNDCAKEEGSLFGWLFSCDYKGDGCTVLQEINAAAGCGSDAYDLSSLRYVVDGGPDGDQLSIILATTNTDGSDSFASATFAYRPARPSR